MQELWARVLAGQANVPGSFSRKTVNILADLEPSDAEAFNRLCAFVPDTGVLYPIVFDEGQAIYAENGITFQVVTDLDALGLIHFDGFAGFAVKPNPTAEEAQINYRGSIIRLRAQEETPIDSGHVLFTRAGEELSRLCERAQVPGFVDYLKERWRKDGMLLEP